MADKVNHPKVEDYPDLDTYRHVVLEFFGVSKITDVKIYRTWKNMKNRCRNPNVPGYKNYGGRDIKVCDRWLSNFLYFFSDMGPKPTDEVGPTGRSIWSIERIDNNGDYEPDNCIWASYEEQRYNTRIEVKRYEYQDELYTINELHEISDIPDITPGGIRGRLKRGWSVEEAINTPITEIKLYEYQGKFYPLRELSEMFDIDVHTLYIRIEKLKWDIEHTLTTPILESKQYAYKNELYAIGDLSDKTGISKHTLYYRIEKLGMSVEEAINTPITEIKLYEYQGKFYTNAQLAEMAGIDPTTMYNRLIDGWSLEEAINTPIVKVEKFYYNGRMVSIPEISEETGVGINKLYYRIKVKGMGVEEAINMPPKEITFQDETFTINKWGNWIGPHSVSTSCMLGRRNKGFLPRDILMPDKNSLWRNLGVLPDITIIFEDSIGIYHNIIHCAEWTGMKLTTILDGLNDPNSNIMYTTHWNQLGQPITQVQHRPSDEDFHK